MIKEGLANEDETTEGIIDALVKNWGVEIPEGEEISEDIDGLNKVVDIISDTKAIERVEEYFIEMPELKEFRDFLQLGGKPEDYMKTKYPDVDYSKLDIKDEDVQKSVVATYYKGEGLDPDKIKKKIEKWEAAGLLEDESAEILEKLQKKQEKEKESLIKDQTKLDNDRKEAAKSHWKTIADTIDKSTAIKGLNIPIKDKDKLYQYMSQAKNKNGLSQEMIDDMEMPIEDQIALAYIKMNKLNLSKLIQNEAATSKAKEKLAFKNTNTKVSTKARTSDNVVDVETLHERLLQEEDK